MHYLQVQLVNNSIANYFWSCFEKLYTKTTTC